MFELGPTYRDDFVGRLMRLGSALARDDRQVDRLVSPLRRPLDRLWYRRSGRLRDLGELGESVSRASPRPLGIHVLVVSLRMWTHHTAYESVIAQALRLRGAQVTLLTCGGGQPICEVGWGRRVWPRPCDRCAWFTDRVASRGRFAHVSLADEFPWGRGCDHAPREPSPFFPGDRESTAASVAWFSKSADQGQVPDGAAIGTDFRVAAEAVAEAFERLLDRLSPDVVLAVNGLFAAEHAMRSVAAARGVPVVTYELAPRKDALVFGRESAAPDMEMDGLAEDQMGRPLSAREAGALDALLRARVTGESAHESYFDETLRHEAASVRASLGLTGARVVSAFTNLSWDTALLGKDVAFDSQFEWLAEICRVVRSRDDLTLVIRVHPAEGRWGTAQPVEQELSSRVGGLPPNVVLVRPDQPLSSYGLLATSELALCYTTTVGLEAAVRGIPVALAGVAHYRGRGFTIDVNSRADLERVLAEPPTMSPEQVELARRYAFAFFFRLMIPFEHIASDRGRLTGVPVSGEALLPGRDAYLDFVCDRILDGGEFFLPPELALPPSAR